MERGIVVALEVYLYDAAFDLGVKLSVLPRAADLALLAEHENLVADLRHGGKQVGGVVLECRVAPDGQAQGDIGANERLEVECVRRANCGVELIAFRGIEHLAVVQVVA